jgi:hypothetical protein
MGSGIFYIVRFYGSGNFGLKYGRNYASITIGHTVLNGPSEDRPSSPIWRMRVNSDIDVWTGFV